MIIPLGDIFAPGFFVSAPVQTALLTATGAAVVSGAVGVLTVMRGQSFAGHALADVSSAGGSLSFLLGISPLLGFLGLAAFAAGAMELAGVRRAREYDLLTGIVLGAGLGCAALFLYLDVTSGSRTGAAVTVMFGSMFALPAATVPLALGIGAVALAVIAALYRPLLLIAVSPDLARVQGTHVRVTRVCQLLVLALAVSLSAMTVGAILSTALLIGPAATALRLTKRAGMAILLAAIIGLGATWAGILLAYDSDEWTPGHGWPVSFFIVALIFISYLAAEGLARAREGDIATSGA